MPIKISISSPNLDNLARQVGETADTLLDGFDWRSMAPVIAEYAAEVFATEGYGQWPALSPQYAAWKESRYPGLHILELTGAYLAAATEIGAPFNFIEVGDNSLTYGVDGLDYPRYHEEGTTNLPRREVFELLAQNNELAIELTVLLSEWVAQRLSPTGIR